MHPSGSKLVIGLLVLLGLLVSQLLALAQTEEQLPIPKRRYLIAFSNGEMTNPWRWAFVDSMEEWAYKFKNLGPGIDYIWTNAGNDSARQLMDCETLLAMQPDILIVSPNQDEPLDPVIDMATAAGVPLMIIDRSLVREPPVGTYFVNITQNYAMSGAYQAVYALEWLKVHYGEYRGNIVEIQGIIGSSPTTDEYVGIRAILKHFPDVKIIATGEGSYSQAGGRRVMEDFLARFGPGEIDLIICYNDAEALGALEAIEAAGRTELLTGRILGKDQQVAMLRELLAGSALMTTECPPYYGPYAIPLAIRYLNGEETPPPKVYLPLRCWENPHDEIDLTPGDDEAIIKAHIQYCEEHNLALVPPETGNFDELTVDISSWPGYDEIMRYTEEGVWPEGIYDLQNTRE